MIRFTALRRHLLPALLFFAMSVAWTWPLALHLSTDIPGFPGDNLAFLWNAWWMRTALASHASVFHTDQIFAPMGVDLTLHTHTALTSWVAATALGRLPVVTAHNLTMLASLTLNGVAAYLLAWDRLKERGAAIVAGVIFGGAPYLVAHLLGHVNLLSAWGIPLFTLFGLRALERRSWRASVAAGLVLVLTAYADYYYAVYCVALAAALYGFDAARVDWTRTKLPRGVRSIVTGLIALDVALIAAVIVTGGFRTELLGVRVVATRPTNLMAFGWGLLAILLLGQFRPRARWVVSSSHTRSRLYALLPMVAVVVAGLAPLWSRALVVIWAGDYAAPATSWRSGPAGVDVATTILGHPWHGWMGESVRALYERLHIDPVESIGWMGVVPVLLAVVALRRSHDAPEVRLWRWVGALFAVWALGPWLRIAGVDTGLLLPQNVIAHIPILSNARMPGRAMVIVFMALAMLAAIAAARATRSRRWILPVVVGLTLFDYWPSPFPLTRIETPAVYEALEMLPPGTLCELPLGRRDGFGVTGTFDDRQLSYQMTHGHPIVGGFVARLPASVVKAYDTMPVVRSLWRLSAGKEADPLDALLSAAETAAALRQATVSYLMLNRDAASPALIDYVERFVPRRLVATDGARALYVVTVPGEAP